MFKDNTGKVQSLIMIMMKQLHPSLMIATVD